MKLLLVFLALIGICGVGGCRSNANPNQSESTSNIQGPISQPKSDIDQSTFDFGLWVNETEFLAADGTATVYFYAEVIGESSAVNLVDSNNNVVAELKDDGQYNTSGDDIQGDGVFTAKVKINLASAGTFAYRAATQVGGKDVVSNEVTIRITMPLTDQDNIDINTVKDELHALYISSEYKKMSLEKKVEAMISLLETLVERGLVREGSITVDGDVVSYEHSSGLISGVMLEPMSPFHN